MQLAITLAEQGILPDSLIRQGMRRLMRERLQQHSTEAESAERQVSRFADSLRCEPIAVTPQKANEQHYELPPGFFEKVLGRHLKYSSGYWPDGVKTLDQAEATMLELSCGRAGLEDGMSVLELGCGWGSLTLWMAEHYPHSSIKAVSNSTRQRAFIEARARERGLANVSVETADMNAFAPTDRFDAAVSVEMFEHMRNLEKLLERISGWLEIGAPLFVHVFSNRRYAYFFEEEGSSNWMGRYFFTAGMMPSHDLLTRFQDHLALEESWHVAGTHYQRTAAAWLRNLDAHRESVEPILKTTYGQDSRRWLGRWRMFFMACEELFGYQNGSEWGVSHYRFRK